MTCLFVLNFSGPRPQNISTTTLFLNKSIERNRYEFSVNYLWTGFVELQRFEIVEFRSVATDIPPLGFRCELAKFQRNAL